jgi:hypothetical protein
VVRWYIRFPAVNNKNNGSIRTKEIKRYLGEEAFMEFGFFIVFQVVSDVRPSKVTCKHS